VIRKQDKTPTSQITTLADQRDMAQKTARLQALTFLATFQAEAMKVAPASQYKRVMQNVELYSRKAIALLGALGENLEGIPADTGLLIYTPQEAAIQRLHDYVNECEKRIDKNIHSVPKPDSVIEICAAIGYAAGHIYRWANSEASHALFPSGECKKLAGFLEKHLGLGNPPNFAEPHKITQWKTKVQQFPVIVRQKIDDFEQTTMED
jgi:hypothetical protein